MDFENENEVKKGLAARRRMARESRVIDMMGRFHADIFFQNRYMLNKGGVKIKLIRSKDAFSLMKGVNYKVKITHALLFVRNVKVIILVFLAHAKAMNRGTAKYPIRCAVSKSFTILQNYLDMNHEKLFFGQVSTRIVIGLVDNRAFNGSRDRNPFNFANFNLHEIGLYLDGQQQHALRPIQPNFATGEYIKAYTIFAGTGKLGADEGLYITRDKYANGYSLYAFDLTADLGEDDHFSLVKQGSVRLALKFSQALKATVTVIAYAEFENVIEIDRKRNVDFDFGHENTNMNTREIEGVLRGARVKDFDGVFSVDILLSKPYLLVVNTDESHKPGCHWVCM